jgi:tetratricopeptide (TPR) repeat protein
MPHHTKILFLCILFFTFFSANAHAVTDTTTKRVLMSNIITSNLGDYSAYIKDGIAAIRSDSLDKGIHLLSIGIKHVFASKNITRVLDYHTLEFIDIVEILDTAKLSKSEKQAGQDLLKAAFIKQGKTTEKFITNIKRLPNTPFALRLKVLLFSFSDSPALNSVLNQLLKDQPDLVSANMLKAELLYDEGNYKESVGYCDKVINLSPQYAYAYLKRAIGYAELNEPDKAVTDDETAIRLYPEYVKAYYNRANALFDQDKYHEAIAGYKKSKSLNPGYEYPDYNICRCYKSLNMPDSALYYINLHISEFPHDGDGYNLKGDIYYRREDYPTAIEFYTRAINFTPDKERFYEDRGDAYFYANKVDEALKDFEKSTTLDKKRSYPNDRIGDCYYKIEKYENAISWYQKAIKIDPSYKYAYVGLDLTYIKIGKYNEAITACKRAIEIDSTFDNALGNLGWTYYCAGNFDACIQYSYKALKYNEKAVYAMFNISLATLRKGDFEKAKELYSYFIAKCKEKGYEISNGAVDDLKDLIQKKIAVTEARFIIQNIFEGKL